MIHHYKIGLAWTGNTGEGTKTYRGYDRSHIISAPFKPKIEGHFDPAFGGDKTKYNPEDLFVASISACHMLWYLHLCADAGVIVIAYTDEATGTLIEKSDGSGHFEEVTLHPKVTVKEKGMEEKAMQLHHDAHKMCFIANSCNFPVKNEPVIETEKILKRVCT